MRTPRRAEVPAREKSDPERERAERELPPGSAVERRGCLGGAPREVAEDGGGGEQEGADDADPPVIGGLRLRRRERTRATRARGGPGPASAGPWAG